MRLKSLEYSEHEGAPEEWILRGFTPGNVNLLVGKNASGKSRVLNVIHKVAQGITGERKRLLSSNGHASLVFDEDGRETKYELKTQDNKITAERFVVDGKTKLDRGAGGKGKIHADREGKLIEFQTPENQLAVVARRDTLQHPFFEPLHQWAISLYHYAFGTSLGKESFSNAESIRTELAKLNPRDTSRVIPIFQKASEDFGTDFAVSVQEDFRSVGYSIDGFGFSSLRDEISLSKSSFGIYVQETDLPAVTTQDAMSQGMFRTLSLLIQINYAILADTPSCILIDDIGEGLDFERSRSLIELLMRKVKDTPVQLIMATNDRFVMNHVPLEAWSVVDRQGNHVTIRDYANSKEIFDRFKFTGLNNFDFLATDYLHASE